MNRFSKSIITTMVLISLLTGLVFADVETEVNNVLSKTPASNSGEVDKLSAKLLEMGPEAVRMLCSKVTPAGKGNDTKARMAIKSLSLFIGKNAAQQQRKDYANVIAGAVLTNKDRFVKEFFVKQLQLVGGDESVTVLGMLLKNKGVCDAGCRALLAIGTEKASEMLLIALDSVDVSNKAAVIKTIGEFENRDAAKKLIGYTNNSDREIRLAALFAIANIGDSSAKKVLKKATLSENLYEKAKANSFYLLYAKKLAQQSKEKQAVKICKNIYEKSDQITVRIQALSVLVDIQDNRAQGILLEAIESDNDQMQAAILQLAQNLGDENDTLKWAKKLDEVSDNTKIRIITMLADRGDKSALGELTKLIKPTQSNGKVAAEAVSAIAKLGQAESINIILSALDNGEAERVKAVRESLKLLSGKGVTDAVANKLAASNLPAESKIVLIEFLAERLAKEHKDIVLAQTKDADDKVKLAATKALADLANAGDIGQLVKLMLDAENSKLRNAAQKTIVSAAKRASEIGSILTALDNAGDKSKALLLETLSKLGGKEAINKVLAQTTSSVDKVKDAALRALANWPDEYAISPLLDIAAKTEDSKYHVITLRGCLRIISTAAVPAGKKIELYKKAMKIAKRDDEKKMILAGLSKIKNKDALLMAGEYLDDDGLNSEAALAVAKIACGNGKKDKGMQCPKAAELLKKAKNFITDDKLKEKVQKQIDSIPQVPEDFVSLFNGVDLSGWKGLVENPEKRAKMTAEELTQAQGKADALMNQHWGVEDGMIVFKGEGYDSICTVKDYSDFELQLEWKIEKGADSGIYLRGCPQVQIWDAEANPVGSGGLYNNKKNLDKPLKVADKPVGQWNHFRIIMVDSKVTIYLNGELVVDNVELENYWDRNKDMYPTGQIELQAHASKLYFRNVYIKELPWGDALFNGKDLTGWAGEKKAYVVNDGVLAYKPELGGGSLFTDKDYSDFILHFEFKLTPGANNGLAIRTPFKSWAAYDGMELQIIDNTAEKYKDLHAYQFHGSVYGVAPAKRGFLKPVGQWNFQEVIAKGRQITVNLNGNTILDVDLDKVSTPATVDGKEHPGLKRSTGRIGFLSHSDPLEFRNIRIKELKN